MMGKCHFCGRQADLRPYGPEGESICFRCGQDPVRRETTMLRFIEHLVDCGPLVVIDENGPRPMTDEEKN